MSVHFVLNLGFEQEIEYDKLARQMALFKDSKEASILLGENDKLAK
jgi:hypothetical protein